ncbi:GNAT family N-acetyltransferase [Glycomyces tarimensis]
MTNTPVLVETGLRVLLGYAARGETLTYGTLNRELGNPFSHGGNFPGQIGRLCDAINVHHDAVTGLPFMISALVHNGSTQQPGPGFFALADRLGLLPGTDDDLAKRRFVDGQLAAIYDHYQGLERTRSVMAGVEIRRVHADELESVAGLRWRWESERLSGPAVERDEFVVRFVAWARRNEATHRCFVAVGDETVIGMAWLAVTARVPTPLSLDRLAGDLQSMYVVPEERGNGLGSRLIEAVLGQAREAGLVRVTVHSSDRAIPVYARHGFESAPSLMMARFS